MAINLTLNDFRSVLGKVNDGNVVLKQDQSGIEKANYGSKILNFLRTVRTADNNPQENVQVRQSLLTAIHNSAEGKILSRGDMERIYAALGMSAVEGNNAASFTASFSAPLSRRELKNVIDIIDSATKNDALIQEDIAALDAKGLLDKKVAVESQDAHGRDGASLRRRLQGPQPGRDGEVRAPEHGRHSRAGVRQALLVEFLSQGLLPA